VLGTTGRLGGVFWALVGGGEEPGPREDKGVGRAQKKNRRQPWGATPASRREEGACAKAARRGEELPGSSGNLRGFPSYCP